MVLRSLPTGKLRVQTGEMSLRSTFTTLSQKGGVAHPWRLRGNCGGAPASGDLLFQTTGPDFRGTPSNALVDPEINSHDETAKRC
jgi:hypothetical protein